MEVMRIPRLDDLRGSFVIIASFIIMFSVQAQIIKRINSSHISVGLTADEQHFPGIICIVDMSLTDYISLKGH